ncbi:3-phosphoshikimate 1-carboxyvinyltransferase [Leucobacter sp. wl10]|uniref:3-phosphoshikimate 1-carboxyvinyltransferase n=1 Tax=Leucobacter sp. wl10 TaxID=2304677 RepID=UPI000E5AAF03|nr:3-phosphoshikimate 1-carboxyvinyltransferase [Leucobacter sp. wl10]RGE22030.1 3-phosphoshikimate 1-carboxyvinyltransferase [Leucobacter sp. wl10]
MTTDFIPRVPGSRSIAARALVCAALADGTSAVSRVPRNDDARAMAGGLDQTAATLREEGSDAYLVTGSPRFAPPQTPLDCNASGTTMRFLAALSVLTDAPVLLTGTDRLLERPMEGLYRALRRLGKEIEDRPGLRRITGAPTIPGSLSIDASDSGQFVSGLLMALAASGHGVELRALRPVSRPFIAMTATVMRAFGAEIEMREDGEDLVFVIAGSGYRHRDYAVEPDIMSANYFAAAAAITGRPVFIPDVLRNTMQGDAVMLETLEEMGATVDWRDGGVRVSRAAGAALRGRTADLAPMPDMCLTIGAVAAVAEGDTTLTSTRILRHKESDRLSAMITELGKLGISTVVTADDDTLVIRPNGRLEPAAIDTFEDHRMAMAFGLLTLVEPRIVINDPECSAKTWPGFFAELERYRTGA